MSLFRNGRTSTIVGTQTSACGVLTVEEPSDDDDVGNGNGGNGGGGNGDGGDGGGVGDGDLIGGVGTREAVIGASVVGLGLLGVGAVMAARDQGRLGGRRILPKRTGARSTRSGFRRRG